MPLFLMARIRNEPLLELTWRAPKMPSNQPTSVLDLQKLLHVSAIAPSQGSIHSTSIFRHLIALWLITPHVATGKGIIFADSRNVPREHLKGLRLSNLNVFFEAFEFQIVWGGIFVFLELV